MASSSSLWKYALIIIFRSVSQRINQYARCHFGLSHGRNGAYADIGGDYAMNPCELTVSITAMANAIACNRSADEINLLGVAFTQLGDTLLTIATQKSICCKTDT